MNDDMRRARELGIDYDEYRKAVRTYHYYVEGSDVNHEPWRVTGYIDVLPGDIFGNAWQVIGAEVMMQLTKGLAVFGKPGVGCKGPYRITEMRLKERMDWESDKGLTE